MHQVQAFAQRKMIDATPFFHDQARWIDPGQSDSATRMDLVTELFLQKRTAQSPRQEEAKEH
jgi:hypothetical protein